MSRAGIRLEAAARQTAVYLALCGVAAFMLLPFAWMVATSLSDDRALLAPQSARASEFLPADWRVENYARVYDATRVMGGGFARWYFNSLLVALVVTLGQVSTSACAAYAFARLEFPGRDRLFLGYLATLMVPGAVTMIPNFILMRELAALLERAAPLVDWTGPRTVTLFGQRFEAGRLAGTDSYFALTVPVMFSAYGTFMLRQFFLGIPRELEEAAALDGCGLFRTFVSVILPLSKPALAALTIFTFMGSWRSFYWPLIMVSDDAMKTLPLGLQTFMGLHSAQWTLLMAGSVMMIVPMIIVFVIGQKWFISGIQLGALKG
jgi:multiple sugar transport system permease protein